MITSDFLHLYMKEIYTRIYEYADSGKEEKDWREAQQTRQEPHTLYRHMVRYFTYFLSTDVTYKDISKTEAELFGTAPRHHSSIIHSIRVVRNGLKEKSVFKEVTRIHSLVLETLEYKENPKVEKIFELFRAMPHENAILVFETLLRRQWIPIERVEAVIEKFAKPFPEHNPITHKPKLTVKNDEITLTDSQLEALSDILTWYEDPEAPLYKVLSGYAGTGKTTLLHEVVEAVEKGLSHHVIVTATTNKAVKVLRERVEAKHFSTIHSVLKIKPKQIGTKEIFEPDPYIDSIPLSSYNLVIVDECSMISEKLLELIYEENVGNTKVLFCGDPAQLQPINEDISTCFSFQPSTLTEVVRHGDTIAQKAVLARDNTTVLTVEELLAGKEIIRISKKEIWERFKNFREDPDRIRMLAWTNRSVNEWNKQLRLADYGRPVEDTFTEGDIIIANQPCIHEGEIVMMNSEEAEVIHVDKTDSSYVMQVERLDGKRVQVRSVREKYRPVLKDQLDILAAEREWKEYWRLRKFYHDVRHCYALTVHKSQGSTFDSVVLDWRDINSNRDIQNRNQLIYVGLTRAAKTVMIYNR